MYMHFARKTLVKADVKTRSNGKFYYPKRLPLQGKQRLGERAVQAMG